MPSSIVAARWYASAMNWYVLPIHSVKDGRCSCGKVTCGSKGKHPRTLSGVHDATIDLDVINAWWSRWPDANVGIATGAVSDIVVVDIDPRNGGDASYRRLSKQSRSFAEVSAYTGGGGRHLFYAYDADEDYKYKPAEGIEIKATGGYVVAAPSLHESGKRYKWQRRPFKGARLAAVPRWALNPSLKTGRSHRDRVDPKKVIREGARDNEVMRIAGAMRRIGFGRAEIYAALEVHNRMYCEPPLANDDIDRIARSVMRYEPQEPEATAQAETNLMAWPLRRRNSKRTVW